MVQATCNGWISASGVSIYLLHYAARDQRVGAGRADHNHDLGGGSIEDLGLVQGDRWGRPRHRWGWPVRVVDQGGGSGGPGHGTPQAFNSAVDLPRARLGRRQRSIGPARVVDQGGSARGVRQGGGSGGPGHGTPPRRSTLRWICPGRALGEGSGRSGLGAPWTRAAQLATSAWAVAPSRTWA